MPKYLHTSETPLANIRPTTDNIQSTRVCTYTAPAPSPKSINDDDDLRTSAQVVVADAEEGGLFDPYDAVLVACYSVHPLVSLLAEKEGESNLLAVTGIFEASILACLALLRPGKKWGIVTTGKFWEEHLTQGVTRFLGTTAEDANARFAGVESTGLEAGDFHGDSPDMVQHKLGEATARLLDRGDVECIVMGCAGMAGLEDIIRSAAVDKLGAAKASELLIVDSVKAGVGVLEQAVHNKRTFRGAK